MNNMETTEIVKQAEGLANDEEKLMFLGKYLGDNLDVLEPRDFIQLLIPLVDITRRRYEQNTTLDTMTDYSIALTKLADYFIKNEQGWQATPLLIEAEELLREQPDLEENAEWKYNTYSQIGECYYANQRRLKAKDAYNQALLYATSAGLDTEECNYCLQRIEHPTLKYDPVEDTDGYLAVIDEVERRLYEELKDEPRHMGFCFHYWSAKRDLLAEYGIEWRSPRIMNPRVMFD
jgi:tetratricopeptide (TPR) repeat protein